MVFLIDNADQKLLHLVMHFIKILQFAIVLMEIALYKTFFFLFGIL